MVILFVFHREEGEIPLREKYNIKGKKCSKKL